MKYGSVRLDAYKCIRKDPLKATVVSASGADCPFLSGHELIAPSESNAGTAARVAIVEMSLFDQFIPSVTRASVSQKALDCIQEILWALAHGQVPGKWDNLELGSLGTDLALKAIHGPHQSPLTIAVSHSQKARD